MSIKHIVITSLLLLSITLPVNATASQPVFADCEPTKPADSTTSKEKWVQEYTVGGMLLNKDIEAIALKTKQPQEKSTRYPATYSPPRLDIQSSDIIARWYWGIDEKAEINSIHRSTTFLTSLHRKENLTEGFNMIDNVNDQELFLYPFLDTSRYASDHITLSLCGEYLIDNYLYFLLGSNTTPELSPYVAQAEFTELMTEFVTAYEADNGITDSEIDMNFPAIETKAPFFYRIWQRIKSTLRF